MTKYGSFDGTKFSLLELRMYTLIQSGFASMYELEEYYTLEEALKLYALIQMTKDIEAARNEEINKKR